MNTLTEAPIADLRKVIQARETISQIERKLFPFLSKNDGDHDGGNDGHNGHRRSRNKAKKMSPETRNRISASMRKLWQKRRKSRSSKQTAPA